jgi:hypothetical protein
LALEELLTHGNDAGRDPDTIRKTVLWTKNALEERDAFRAACEQSEYLGFEAVFVMPFGPEPRTAAEQLARLLGLAG